MTSRIRPALDASRGWLDWLIALGWGRPASVAEADRAFKAATRCELAREILYDDRTKRPYGPGAM